ncbi:hypothetical protein CLOHAE12215_01734 [Clostridium haemolyticum]|uniref:hypothetical protein n=1 Tax=Clostridium haemolyticum TaxID=84025 RepID=UPI001C3991E7|nr:hypothetical protein [Clostridium haemolyticum]CAG7840310.1 hypothetical protein CLOHAE12215_01734 [Clostridium haemolyticum]
MNNKSNKYVAVLSSAALGTLIATTVATTALAKTTGILVKDNAGKNFEYDIEQLKNSAIDKSLGDTALLFDDYQSKELVAFHDNVKGYVNGQDVLNASVQAAMEGEQFDLDNFTEKEAPEDTILDVKDIAKVSEKDGKIVTENDKEKSLKIEQVSAITKTKIKVKFSTEVDSALAENFKIEGGTVTTATLSQDKKNVELEVSGLHYGKTYNVVAKNVLVNGVSMNTESVTFGTPAVNETWKLQLTSEAKEGKIMADGADNTVITAKLINVATGEVDTNADNVLVAFSTTYGNLANTRVAVQHGVAKVVLNSEFSARDINAKIDAQVIEASGDYKDLIGKMESSLNIKFVTSAGDIVSEQKPALNSADSNQADRVILNFNKPVDIDDFVQKDKITNKYLVDKDGNAILIDNQDKNTSIVEVEQDGVKKAIRGFKKVENNPKAIEVILQKSDVLQDNKEVTVKVNMPSNVGIQKTTQSFILTDARKPEATSVKATGLREIKVRFSEAIYDAQVKVDGGLTEIEETKDCKFGEFNQVTGEDTRDIMTIKTKDYLKAGSHSVQLASIYDFAGFSDSKNISTSQSLDFTVESDDTVPTASVKVESPEQFRIAFSKIVENFDASKLVLQRYDANDKNATSEEDKWKDADVKNFKDLTSNPEFTVTHVENTSEYVVELTKDWTEIYNTSETKKNYYNDQYRFVIEEGKVKNPLNGKTNQKIVLSLNNEIMKQPDTESPVISGFEVTDFEDVYNVVMSEPVKLKGKDNSDTPSQQQINGVPDTIVEFIGKDKNGNTITIPGVVTNYVDKNLEDRKFSVKPAEGQESLKKLVNNGADENWKLVVRSISDDVGNTAPSLTHDFKVTKDRELSEVFMADGEFRKQPYHGIKGYLNGDKADTIVIKFTSGVQYVGDVKNAVNPSNYLLDGENLPKGTIITVGDSDNNKENGYDTITITVPDGTLKTSKTNVITISKSLKSYKETSLTGYHEVEFSIADDLIVDKKADKKVLNDKIEEFSKLNEKDYTAETWKAFTEALKNAQTIAGKEDATEDEVKAQVKAIEDAKGKLAKDDAKKDEVKKDEIPFAVTTKSSPSPGKIIVVVKLDGVQDASKYNVKVAGQDAKFIAKTGNFVITIQDKYNGDEKLVKEAVAISEIK